MLNVKKPTGFKSFVSKLEGKEDVNILEKEKTWEELRTRYEELLGRYRDLSDHDRLQETASRLVREYTTRELVNHYISSEVGEHSLNNISSSRTTYRLDE